MTIEAIQGTPGSDSVSANAHLYLWVPSALLLEGLSVMQTWGFRYVSNVIWVKRRKDRGPDGRGVGFHFRNVTELLLFGVRGSMRTVAPARRQVNLLETGKREHSRRPDEQHRAIESWSPGPYLELFARLPRAGSTTWETRRQLMSSLKARCTAGTPEARWLVSPGNPPTPRSLVAHPHMLDKHASFQPSRTH